jgi:hypothetical protein
VGLGARGGTDLTSLEGRAADLEPPAGLNYWCLHAWHVRLSDRQGPITPLRDPTWTLQSFSLRRASSRYECTAPRALPA